MRRAECVVAVDVTVRSEFLREFKLLFFHRGFLRLVLLVGHVVLFLDLALLLGVEAGVFEHDHVAGLHRGDFLVGIRAVRRKHDRLAEQLRQIFRDRLQAEISLVSLFRRTAEVAHQHEAAAVVEHVFDRRERTLDPGIILDDPVFDRNVEVHAHNDALAFEIDVAKSFLIHDISPS